MPARPPLLATITARTPSATTATATITIQRCRGAGDELCGSSFMVFRSMAQACARLPEANLTVCERSRPRALSRPAPGPGLPSGRVDHQPTGPDRDERDEQPRDVVDGEVPAEVDRRHDRGRQEHRQRDADAAQPV